MTSEESFSAALAAIEAAGAADRGDPTLDPRCLTFVLHHGRKTDRAIVLFHGFTNCPRQFVELAQLFFNRGFNVYVPRLPRHGLLDKLTPSLAGLRADELTACAAQSAQLADGLGIRVCVLGLSVGATIAAWLAQTQALDRVVAIAPFLSVARVPAMFEPVFAGALARLPNFELWWDPRVKERIGPAHAYPRFATHALAQCLKLGENVRRTAREVGPRAGLSILVLNAKDPAIDNATARELWSVWRKHGGTTDEFTFQNLDVRHDIIEPETYADAATLVYPVLLQLVSA
jgi:esterase/lipase